MRTLLAILLAMLPAAAPGIALAQDNWREITPESEHAVDLGLQWLARNQGEAGNWQSNDLGLVALGALAFMSAGHLPDRGPYGDNVRRAIDFLIVSARPSGLLNTAPTERDMYNHGLTVFVLTQAYGMTNDPRLGPVLDRGLKLINDVQCEDGGWDYKAARQARGHDLSLCVMQAKALRGAMDVGFEIQPATVDLAIRYVRSTYITLGPPDGLRYSDHPQADRPGAFTYAGQKVTTAMAAAGAVCLQEFGQYGDFRIPRSMDRVLDDVKNLKELKEGAIPFDAYTTYYIAQGLYQVGGERWKQGYPLIRDAIVKTQVRPAKASNAGDKPDPRVGSWDGGYVPGTPGRLFGTAVAVFALSIPNRYLPILQEGEQPRPQP